MAHIWPKQLPNDIRKSPIREAEVRVYDALEEALNDEFIVFYSRPWLGEDRFGNELDGECDFLVAHLDYGILAIEVKGGGISYDPTTDLWSSRDRHGIRHRIKNPIEQAKRAKYEALDRLKDHRQWRNRRIRIAHGVIFPDAAAPPKDLGADKPRELFCCNKDLHNNLRDWVGHRMGENREIVTNEPLGLDGLKALEDIFAQPMQLKFTLGAQITDTNDQLMTLTPSQFHMIDAISGIKKALIEGGAGTGKTVIAMEAARRSAEDGHKTLLTCYNSSLGHAMQRMVGHEPNLEIMNFHTFCNHVTKLATHELSTNNRDEHYFNKALPDAAMMALESSESLRWETIVVDEGQDFKELWWIILTEALAQGGKLRVFADSNQQVYRNNDAPPADLELIPIKLSQNLRNTKNIHDIADRHYSGFPISAIGPEGTEIDWLEVKDDLMLPQAIVRKLKELIHKEEWFPGGTALLLPNKSMVDACRTLIERTSINITDADEMSEEAVVIDTVRRFKGLERPVILLAFGSSEHFEHEYAYVGVSRASSHLVVAGTKQTLDWLGRAT